MRFFFCFFGLILLCLNLFAQYDTIIKSVIKVPENYPLRIKGVFGKKKEIKSESKIEYYKFSNSKIDICYYPKQKYIECGFFKLFGQAIYLNDKFENYSGCDLDYGSFEIYSYSIDNKSYIFLNANRFGSGTTTRFIYSNLFDISDKKNILYYPLYSIYGSGLSFGDYNGDKKIDFLEIGYKKDSNSSNDFRLVLKTLDEQKRVFSLVENKYVDFRRLYKNDDSFEIIKLESNW